MKKKFACEVDCAACAAKLEDAIKKVDGVEDCTVNFLTQKLTLTAPDDRFDEILNAVIAKAKKVEPDTVITVA
ncbi:MAG: cation transporter [Lachnospiraceae bacterium]|nr:cation transporter [Lachnospiraceae bacterium]